MKIIDRFDEWFDRNPWAVAYVILGLSVLLILWLWIVTVLELRL